MKKGDLRKQAILDAAERLFFERGYEQTSIQDVLDALDLSKGGFYHHFSSKLELLEAVCAQRSAAACGRGIDAAAQCAGATQQLNALFLRGGFFGEENVKYLALMLSSAYAGAYLQLRDSMRRTMLERYLQTLTDILVTGNRTGTFSLREPESVARLLLLLTLDLTDELAAIVAKPEEAAGDFAAMVALVESYERSVERILSAPFGTVRLVDMPRMLELMRALAALGARRPIRAQWNLFDEGASTR